MTNQKLMAQGVTFLKNAAVEEPEDNARRLFYHVTGLTMTTYALEMGEEANDGVLEAYRHLLEKRARHIPLQQLTGSADFYGRDFSVDDHVLIPRYDSETLIEAILPELKEGDHLLDIGTGSGCLILTLLLENETVRGLAADISDKALLKAGQNAEKWQVTDRISFIKSDLFSNIPGEYDIILSNPPYIRTDVIKGLAPEVRDHEPLTALDGGEDGLDIYRRLIPEALNHLKVGGKLFLEIGYDQGESVRQLMESAGFSEVRLIKDLGGNDRVLWGKRHV